MTRIEFIRNTGRWLVLLGLLAAGGFLFASRRISLRNYCAAGSNCNGCGLNRVCHPQEKKKVKSYEKE
jgi:hypothetical protein